MKNRPRNKKFGVATTTPRAARLMEVMGGGSTFHGFALTRDEERAMRKLYQVESIPEESPLTESQSTLHMFRHAQQDGLRLVAFLARHLEPGQDPLAFLIQMLGTPGNVDLDFEDVEWAEEQC